MKPLQGHLTFLELIYSKCLYFYQWNILWPQPGKASPNEDIQIILFPLLVLHLFQCFPLKEKLFGSGHHHQTLWNKPILAHFLVQSKLIWQAEHPQSNEKATGTQWWSIRCNYTPSCIFLCILTDLSMNPFCGQIDLPPKRSCCHLAQKVSTKHSEFFQVKLPCGA